MNYFSVCISYVYVSLVCRIHRVLQSRFLMGKTLLAERNRVSFSSTEVVGGTVCLGLPPPTHPPSHDPAPTTHFVFLRRFVRNFIRLHCVNICRMRGEARTRGYLISRCGTEIMLTAVYTYIYGMYQGFSRI